MKQKRTPEIDNGRSAGEEHKFGGSKMDLGFFKEIDNENEIESSRGRKCPLPLVSKIDPPQKPRTHASSMFQNPKRRW